MLTAYGLKKLVGRRLRKGERIGQELIKQHSEGKDVGGRIELHGPSDLFRRRIGRGASIHSRLKVSQTRGFKGDPKVQYFGLQIRCHKDVGRLEISVNDAPLMGHADGVNYFCVELESLL